VFEFTENNQMNQEHSHLLNSGTKHSSHKVAVAMVFITSDNPESAFQMNASLHHPNTLITPPASKFFDPTSTSCN
jgi:hypothetical protein